MVIKTVADDTSGGDKNISHFNIKLWNSLQQLTMNY